MVDDAFGFDCMGITINKAGMKSDMHRQQFTCVQYTHLKLLIICQTNLVTSI